MLFVVSYLRFFCGVDGAVIAVTYGRVPVVGSRHRHRGWRDRIAGENGSVEPPHGGKREPGR